MTERSPCSGAARKFSPWPIPAPISAARWKTNADFLDAPLAYMSVQILEQAVATAGTNRDKLRKTISSATFKTINGPARFEGVQNVLLPTMISQIQNQQQHIVWPPDQATAKVIAKPAWK